MARSSRGHRDAPVALPAVSAPPASPRAARPVTLKARALMLLARREHSRQELRAKLLPLAQLQQRELEAQAEAALHGDRPAGQPAGTGPLRRGADSGRPPPAADEGHAPVRLLRSAEERLDALLDGLQQQGHLSDARFVESRVHARSARHGNLRIRQELARHGLELDEATEQALKASEFERARQAWQRKFGTLPQDLRERARQMRFLAGRGFSADVIQKVLRPPRGD